MRYSKQSANPNIMTFIARIGKKFKSNNPNCSIKIIEGDPAVQCKFTDGKILEFKTNKDDEIYTQLLQYSRRLDMENKIAQLK